MKQNGKIKDFLLWTVLAIVLGLIVSFAFLPLLGVDPVDSLKIMLTETFSDKFTMGNILIKTTPLILTSLAFAFTYKANLYNIGAQGQFYVGCICAVATVYIFSGASFSYSANCFSISASLSPTERSISLRNTLSSGSPEIFALCFS